MPSDMGYGRLQKGSDLPVLPNAIAAVVLSKLTRPGSRCSRQGSADSSHSATTRITVYTSFVRLTFSTRTTFKHVEPFDQCRERHRRVDISLRHLRAEPFSDQRGANHHQSGVGYVIAYNPTEFIQLSIDEVEKALLLAVFLVALVVILFLQTWRAAVIPVLAIPISLFGSFLVMRAAGIGLNTLSLFGLVLSIGRASTLSCWRWLV